MKINNDRILSLDHSEEKHFSRRGCDNCSDNMGNDIYECEAWYDFNGPDHYYEVDLCGACLCAYHNVDPLGDNCKNIYNI